MPLRVVPRRDRKLNKLVKSAEPSAIRKGRPLYRIGDDASDAYLVLEGHLRMTLRREGVARPQTVAVAGPMELVGEEALEVGSVRRFNVVAGEGCRVLTLPGRLVLKALRGSPKTLSTFVSAQARDHARLLRSCGAPSRVRIADVLVDLAERFGVVDGRRIVVAHWFTHQELADLACVHRSTVTTTLNEWIYEGVLKEGQRALIVAKFATLRKAASAPSS
jgi:CRP/FNR family transcriptional regulator, cyclic AMP receptor protein